MVECFEIWRDGLCAREEVHPSSRHRLSIPALDAVFRPQHAETQEEPSAVSRCLLHASRLGRRAWALSKCRVFLEVLSFQHTPITSCPHWPAVLALVQAQVPCPSTRTSRTVGMTALMRPRSASAAETEYEQGSGCADMGTDGWGEGDKVLESCATEKQRNGVQEGELGDVPRACVIMSTDLKTLDPVIARIVPDLVGD